MIGVCAGVVCWVLLAVPLPGVLGSLLLFLEWRVTRLIALVLPGLADSVEDRFPVLLIALLIVVLVVLPWRSARGQLAPRERPVAAPSDSSVRFLDDGRIIGDDTRRRGHLERRSDELADIAGRRDMAWHSDYATPGGGRVLLDLSEALESGRSFDETERSRDESALSGGSVGAAVPGAEEEGPIPSVDEGQVPRPPITSDGPQAADELHPAPSDPVPEAPFVGDERISPVYTSTPLYRSAVPTDSTSDTIAEGGPADARAGQEDAR